MIAFIQVFTSYLITENKSIQTSSAFETKTFDSVPAINLRPPPADRNKSFDEDDFPKKLSVVKKVATVPANVTSFSIADLQMATGSFSVENLLGEGSFGRVYRAQFDDGKVFLFSYLLISITRIGALVLRLLSFIFMCLENIIGACREEN